MCPPGQAAGWGPGRGNLERGQSAVFEAPAFVAGFDDLAVMGEPVEQRGGHFGIAEDAAAIRRRRDWW